MKSNLDVCIFGNKFNIFIKAIQNTSDTASNCFKDAALTLTHFFVLINDVFKYDSYKCDQSNQKRS